MATPKKSATKKRAAPKAGKKNSGLIFPTGRVGTALRKGRYAKRVSATAGVYLAAVLEYLTAELLELSTKAHNAAKKKTTRLTPRAVCLAVRNDQDLGDLLKNVTFTRGGVVPSLSKALEKKAKKAKKSKKSKSGKKSTKK